MNPPEIWTAGHVNRYHGNDNHSLRNSQDTNHQHSARVGLLLWHLWRDVPRDVLLYALMHDLAEKRTGDMSGEVKRENPLMAELLRQIERQTHDRIGTPVIDGVWAERVDLCDKLDAVLWAGSIDPALMHRHDWQNMIDRVVNRAYELGVGPEIEEMIE